jgi:hypothetical protein
VAISTETVILRVEAQTDGAIRATEKLAAAQQKLADGFKAAVAGGDDMMTKLGDGLKSLPSAASKVGDVLKGIGFDTRTFSNGLKDIGKGLTFDFIRKGLKSLNSDINSTAKATLSAAADGASMGAAFGGPIGAAVGGLAGAVKGLVGGMLESEEAFKKQREVADAQAKAYWDAINAAEKKKKAEEELAPALAEVAKHEKELAERADTTNKIMNESADAYRKASDQADAYANKLFNINHEIRERLKLNGQLAGAGIDNGANVGGLQSGEEAEAVKVSRELRDSETARYAATKSYGDTLVDLAKKETSRNDRLNDLVQIMGDANVSQDIQKKALKEYNDLLKESNKETDEAKKKAEELAKARAEAARALSNKVQKELTDDLVKRLTEGATAKDSNIAKLSDIDLESIGVKQTANGYSVQTGGPKVPTDEEQRRKSQLESIFGPIDQYAAYNTEISALAETFGAFSDAVGAGYEAIVTGKGSIIGAIKSAAAARLLATGKESAIDALRETALGFGSLALGPIGGVSAAAHFKAAALHAGVAVAAGVAASGLGAGGGGGNTTATSSSGGNNSSQGGNNNNSNNDRSTHTSIIVYGDNYAEDSPRMRQLRAERLVKQATGSSAVDHS